MSGVTPPAAPHHAVKEEGTVPRCSAPSAGKSRLARRLTTMLPAMTLPEAFDTTRFHRAADRTAVVTTHPSRAPHHTLSAVGLIGEDRCQCPAPCRWRTMACLFSMHSRTSRVMSGAQWASSSVKRWCHEGRY
jgi:hypothetical protein